MRHLALALLALCLAGYGLFARGDSGLRERDVAGVRSVTLTTSGTLHLRQGSQDRLEIDASTRVLRTIKTGVEGDRLTISRENSPFALFSGKVDYYLTLRDIDAVLTSSSGEVYLDALQTLELSLGSSSSGDIRAVRIEAEFLDVRLTSSGDLTVEDGRVTSQRISCSSSGDYRAAELQTETAEVTLSSSGNAYIRTSQRLTARLTSSGDLILRGQPVIDALTISSSGRFKRED